MIETRKEWAAFVGLAFWFAALWMLVRHTFDLPPASGAIAGGVFGLAIARVGVARFLGSMPAVLVAGITTIGVFAFLALVVVFGSGCGGTHASSDGSVAVDSSSSDGSVAVDSSVDYPGEGLPVSHCYDGAHVTNNGTACHCVHACSSAATWNGYYVCSLAPADNVSGTGNAAGHCNEGRCLDTPTGGTCP